jgi:cell division protein FtsQ
MARNRRKLDRTQATTDLKVASGRLARLLLVAASVGTAATAALMAGTFGYRWVTTSPTFAVRAIAVSGNRRASTDELVRASGLQPGNNLFTADLESAERAVSQQPWVKSVELHRRLPATVQIRVTEREPAMVVDLDRLYFADADGVLFKRALGGDDLDLPVVTGVSRVQFQEHREGVEAQLRAVAGVIELYRARGLEARYRLEEIAVDDEDGLTLQLAPAQSRTELQTVKLGAGAPEEKLEKLASLWDELSRRNVRAEVIHLDNRARPSWVAVKLALTEPAPSGPRH